MEEEKRQLVLEEILTENQIHRVVTKSIGEDSPWILKSSQVKAMERMAGFLGDHLKATLCVDIGDEEKKVHLFIKRMPVWNKPKTRFIDDNNFFRREMLMFQILEEIWEEGPQPWCVKAYIYTDSILVMPDLTFEGYSTRPCLRVLDPEHLCLATSSIAQFHAAFVNYETKKSSNLKYPYSISQEFGHVLAETTFCDSPFLRASSKLSANLLKKLSSKMYPNIEYLEQKLTRLFLNACDSLTEYKDTVNVLLHRDLWANNIMFKYKEEVPTNCLLIDYQCLRYGPPVFDLMMFVYLTTDRRYRQEREKYILDQYYSVFDKNLNEDSKRRMEDLGYDKDNFLEWCEKARMFGMFGAIAIQPFVLMDPEVAVKTFNDPETYEKYVYEDRTEPVVAHALRCEVYKQRNLEVTEEFVETYVLNQF